MLRKFGFVLGAVALTIQVVGIVLDIRSADADTFGHTLFLVGTGLLVAAALFVLLTSASGEPVGTSRMARVLLPLIPIAMVGVGVGAARSDAIVPGHVHPSGAAADSEQAAPCDVGFNNAVFNFSAVSLETAIAHDHSSEGPRDAANPDDTGHGGHEGPQAWESITSAADCEALSEELAIAKSLAEKYPTAADAVEGGWRMVTPYVPKIGAHYMNFSLVDDKFDVEQPEMLLYDGNSTESSIVGLSYYIRKAGEVEPTVGFVGNNDHYHRHIGLCLKDAVVIGGESMPKEVCEALGGKKANGSDGWMSHVWIVPGCESDWGVFSGDNPALVWELGTNSGKAGSEGCGSGKAVTEDYDADPAGTSFKN